MTDTDATAAPAAIDPRDDALNSALKFICDLSDLLDAANQVMTKQAVVIAAMPTLALSHRTLETTLRHPWRAAWLLAKLGLRNVWDAAARLSARPFANLRSHKA